MSSTNIQFSVAVHILAALAVVEGEGATSAEIAKSVNANPSFVRRVLAKLSKAKLVQTTSGKSGRCRLARPMARISMLDVQRAVDGTAAFAIHDYPEQKSCVVSCNIKEGLTHVLAQANRALETKLKSVSLAEVVEGFESK